MKLEPISPSPGPTFDSVVAIVENAVVTSKPQPNSANQPPAKIII
ncbi:hypothetical protein ACP8HZ_01380 [Francisella noatunensis]